MIIYECLNKDCGYCFPIPRTCHKHDGIITKDYKCCPRCKSINLKVIDEIWELKDGIWVK